MSEHKIGDLVMSNDEMIGIIVSIKPITYDPYVKAYHKVVFVDDGRWWKYGEDAIDTLKDNLQRYMSDE